MTYAGVDEAGRGPVLGPLVVAGVAGRRDAVPDTVADSKTLAPARREALADQIHESPLAVATRTLAAEQLNDLMGEGRTLDHIETQAFAAVLDELSPERVLVDPVGTDPDAFADRLTETVVADCSIRAEVEADARDPMVGAASIVAKVRRDAAIDRIREELGTDVGSGYPSDPVTRSFLEDWREQTPHPPPYARTAWSTLDEIGFGQRRLGEPVEPDPASEEETT